jgi:ParB-like nuclease family protein
MKDHSPPTDGRSFERPIGRGSGSPRPPPCARGPRDYDSNAKAARIAVRWLPVEALTPDPRNARVHSARQIARIADSIAAFGFNVPVLVDEKGGVLAGHGRVLAARRLGLKEVPTIALDHMTEAESRAFMIADNRLGELASWDDGRLGLSSSRS